MVSSWFGWGGRGEGGLRESGVGKHNKKQSPHTRHPTTTTPPHSPSYEAFVIYNFMALCLAYVGGPGRVEVVCAGTVLAPSLARCTCCLAPTPVNGAFVRRCKRGALQYVLLKPALAIITVVLAARGVWHEGTWSPGGGFFWVQLSANATATIALYSLALFYFGTHDLLAPHSPVLKFLAVKAIVFATFWQGVAISIALAAGGLASPDDGKALQDLLLCVEMLPAAVAMAAAFPAKEYHTGGGPSAGLDAAAVTHAISIRDVIADTVHQFAPAYHNYVLYDGGDGGGGGGGGGGSGKGTPRTARAATFIAVGRETATGTTPARSAAGGGGGGLLGDVELGGVPPVRGGGARRLPPSHLPTVDDGDEAASAGDAVGDNSPRVAAVVDAPAARPPRRARGAPPPAPAAAAPLAEGGETPVSPAWKDVDLR